ncbi:MAG: hypothetical protein HC768_19400 [Acaryochloris sp. CRU_2_0]|nr:hypothetical protein [Acaryochloris sp. CRU_2_0]
MECLERLTASIEILELREVDCDSISDLLGYFAIGHYDPVAFAQAVNAEYAPDPPVEVQQVRHEFWVECPLEPGEPDCDCTYFEPCRVGVEGAMVYDRPEVIAVTYVEL